MTNATNIHISKDDLNNYENADSSFIWCQEFLEARLDFPSLTANPDYVEQEVEILETRIDKMQTTKANK